MPFIILDRDGVINHESAEYIKSPEEWIPIPGSLQAIASLNKAGFHVFVATNQSGVARGFYDLAMLDCIHEKLVSELASYGGVIDEIFFCPHHPDDRCACRKPEPGLIHRIQEKYNVPLSETYFVGDSAVDMLAARRAGCRPLLVLSGNGSKTLKMHPEFLSIPRFVDLSEVANALLSNSR